MHVAFVLFGLNAGLATHIRTEHSPHDKLSHLVQELEHRIQDMSPASLEESPIELVRQIDAQAVDAADAPAVDALDKELFEFDDPGSPFWAILNVVMDNRLPFGPVLVRNGVAERPPMQPYADADMPKEHVIFQSGTASYIYGCRTDGFPMTTDSDFWVKRRHPGTVTGIDGVLNANGTDFDQFDAWRVGRPFIEQFKLCSPAEIDSFACELLILRLEVKTTGELSLWAAKQGMLEGIRNVGLEDRQTWGWAGSVDENPLVAAHHGHHSHDLALTVSIENAQILLDEFSKANKVPRNNWLQWNGHHETDMYTYNGAFATGFDQYMDAAYTQPARVKNELQTVNCRDFILMKQKFYEEAVAGKRNSKASKNHSKGINDLLDTRCMCGRLLHAAHDTIASYCPSAMRLDDALVELCDRVEATGQPLPFVEGVHP